MSFEKCLKTKIFHFLSNVHDLLNLLLFFKKRVFDISCKICEYNGTSLVSCDTYFTKYHLFLHQDDYWIVILVLSLKNNWKTILSPSKTFENPATSSTGVLSPSFPEHFAWWHYVSASVHHILPHISKILDWHNLTYQKLKYSLIFVKNIENSLLRRTFFYHFRVILWALREEEQNH